MGWIFIKTRHFQEFKKVRFLVKHCVLPTYSIRLWVCSLVHKSSFRSLTESVLLRLFFFAFSSLLCFVQPARTCSHGKCLFLSCLTQLNAASNHYPPPTYLSASALQQDSFRNMEGEVLECQKLEAEVEEALLQALHKN